MDTKAKTGQKTIKKRLVKPNGNTQWVTWDGGNSLLKMMCEGSKSRMSVIPHALRVLSGGDMEKFVQRAKRGNDFGNDTFIFTYQPSNADSPVHYMVGVGAESVAAETRRSGGEKMTPDYYAPLALAQLLYLFPSGHDNLAIMAAYPPGDYRFVEQLMDCLGGTHIVTLPDGRAVTYKVRQVKVYEEPIGGFWNYLMARDGIHYSRENIDPSALALAVDIGGKISSLVPFRANGWVDYSNAPSIDIGIQDVMQTMSDLILANKAHEKRFKSHRGDLPFDENMRQSLITGIYHAAGYELSVLDEVAESTRIIRNQIKDVYQQRLGGSRPYYYIIITGGGGGLLYTQLTEHVLNFNPDKVFRASDNETMHLANVMGGDKILTAMLSRGAV